MTANRTETPLAAEAVAIWRAGVEAVLPAALFRRAVQVDGGMIRFEGRGTPRKFKVRLDQIRRIGVVGAGKAGAGMAAALEESLGDVLAAKDVRGYVNVPDSTAVRLSRIELHPSRATHDNTATPEALAGTKRIREFASKLTHDDLLVVLLSGGGSALLPMPIEGVTFEEKMHVVSLLQARGADIREVNCVRRHLSEVKGGGLVNWTRAGLIVTLAISDVPGDPLEVIASGPTAPDPTTYTDALRILAKYGAGEGSPDTPRSVLEIFREGSEGLRGDTLKIPPKHVKNLIVGTNDLAVQGAERHARVLGWKVLASSAPVCGDTRELSRTVASFVRGADARAAAESRRGVCLLSGGETTTVLGPSPGRGGRNQEMPLGVLAELGAAGMRGACVLSGGTDGEDGPTDVAGAWIDEAVARRAEASGLDPERFLAAHDSYRFYEKAGGHLRTGYTGTNVMDLRVALVDVAARAVAASEDRTIPLRG